MTIFRESRIFVRFINYKFSNKAEVGAIFFSFLKSLFYEKKKINYVFVKNKILEQKIKFNYSNPKLFLFLWYCFVYKLYEFNKIIIKTIIHNFLLWNGVYSCEESFFFRRDFLKRPQRGPNFCLNWALIKDIDQVKNIIWMNDEL